MDSRFASDSDMEMEMSENPHAATTRRVVIAGCGFVGRATARIFHANDWSVLGLTSSRDSLAPFAGEPFPVVACDIANEAAVTALCIDIGTPDVVIHCASSRRGGADEYRRTYFSGAQILMRSLRPRHFILTSSTSVYAQTDGGWVTEESETAPVRETAQILRETEDYLLEQEGTVARLAGIYGPGRSVLLQRFFNGTAVLEGDGDRWINQVHRDDVASALKCIADRAARGIFNVADNHPFPQRVIYARLSSMFPRPLPRAGPIDPDRKRAWTNKQVSNAKLRALGWQPRFPSFFDAIENDPGLLQPFLS
ncbi:MAG TPA: NAD-dependent epimerase/dehydratase family protein [Chthoniobacteraceae bacterium]|nr:NAD-dependent epimerase/dehydratase family protein [Chthoniobacteraceae bacterium]